MIVDCGGGTIDLTIHKLVGNNQLSEVTESTGDFCGSTFIDKEYIKFLCKKLGDSAINSFRDNFYGQFQYMIQTFCNNAKIPFTGDSEFFFELDIEDTAPVLLKYVNEETRYIMEENDWMIKINYEDIKAMFDPVVNRIIKLIHLQLSNVQEKCSAMFLIGGFSESKYLQKRIREEFQHRVKNILVSIHPIAAISRGAALYGFSLFNSKDDNMKVTRCIIATRILKYTYGIKVRNYWLEGDPIERKIRDGRIDRFHCIAKRGIQVNANEEFTTFFTPLSPMQTRVCFKIYYTKEYSAKYCDEPGMNLLGKLIIDPDILINYYLGFLLGKWNLLLL
ncbi:actin-like ATPase domain-containing protein [Rhizophagus irregularis]|uniref:Actin-like ATPase domain-containing protein n=1 Tax=Rhizophagus irregularis TaxID=588596 RepID=A0A2N1P2N2_9GLOM|nr:actin-like ATPase domain-containing protein [Rhizophagus irregularis]